MKLAQKALHRLTAQLLELSPNSDPLQYLCCMLLLCIYSQTLCAQRICGVVMRPQCVRTKQDRCVVALFKCVVYFWLAVSVSKHNSHSNFNHAGNGARAWTLKLCRVILFNFGHVCV